MSKKENAEKISEVPVLEKTKKALKPKVVPMVKESKDREEIKPAKKSKVQFKNRLALDEAVSYFEAIVAGLKKGEIELKQEDNHLVLSPQSEVSIEVKASAKEEKGKVSFKISWEKVRSSEQAVS